MKRKKWAALFCALTALAFLAGNHIAALYQNSAGNILERTQYVFSKNFLSFSFSLNKYALLGGLLGVIFFWAFWFYNFGRRGNARPGEEHGSAKWGKPEDARPFQSPDQYGNIILSKNTGLALSNKGKDYKYHTNKNILVIGGSGSGKTLFFVEPNILQLHSCYIVTDPKGTSLSRVGDALKSAGYEIKCFNTVDLKRSMRYNPLEYAKTEQDILKLVDALMLNTTSPDSRSSEQFWQDAEKLLYTGIIAFIVFDLPDEIPKNFNTFLELLGAVKVSEDRPEEKNAMDVMFEDLLETKGETFSHRCYSGFRKAHPKTATGIIISACARLMPFYISDLRGLFEYDEMELDKIGNQKTAHFLIVDDTDTTFNFMVGLLYSQMLTRMIRNADNSGGSLPIHTRMIMDEAANIAQIRNLEKVTGQIRSREISACLIYQNPEQLKALYKEKAAVISGNFDTTLFLGSEEPGVGKLISEKIGDETVSYTTQSDARGRNRTYTQSEGIAKRRLLAPEEVRKLPADECIVFIKGLAPIRDKKYTLGSHPRYRESAKFDVFTENTTAGRLPHPAAEPIWGEAQGKEDTPEYAAQTQTYSDGIHIDIKF